MSGPPDKLVVSELVQEALEAGADGTALRVTSSSMRPRLVAGDRVWIERVSARSLRPGDVVVCRVDGAGLVVHRLIWRDRPFGSPTRLYTKGDALSYIDRTVGIERMVGRVVKVEREGRSIAATTLGDRIRCWLLAARQGVARWLCPGDTA